MIEQIVRRLDESTSRHLALTIKALLSDHIRFIRDINRLLIRTVSYNDSRLSKGLSGNNGFFEWYNSLELGISESNTDFIKLGRIHKKLQILARKLSRHFEKHGEIDAETYQKFLDKNDSFFELMWNLTSEVISAQYQFDPLTKLLNRGAFLPMLEHELSAANRNNCDTCVVLIDIDDFKLVNDKWGHDVGDSVLSQFAQLLLNSIRDADYASRHGGEEFLICLPRTDLNTALSVMERFRDTLAIHQFTNDILATASFGIALLKGSTKQSIINADIAMYNAKKQGKNKILTYVQ